MSMDDARLDHLTLRIEEIERVVGCGDAEVTASSVLARLKEAERDINDLEVAKMNRESTLTWDTVKALCVARDAGAGAALSGPQVKAIADLIEGEWGTQ